jgi:hypothetical protein
MDRGASYVNEAGQTVRECWYKAVDGSPVQLDAGAMLLAAGRWATLGRVSCLLYRL